MDLTVGASGVAVPCFQIAKVSNRDVMKPGRD
jgi:hypothetical protein